MSKITYIDAHISVSTLLVLRFELIVSVPTDGSTFRRGDPAQSVIVDELRRHRGCVATTPLPIATETGPDHPPGAHRTYETLRPGFPAPLPAPGVSVRNVSPAANAVMCVGWAR